MMSGTSMDGIDAALICTDGQEIEAFGATHYTPLPSKLREKIFCLMGGTITDEQTEQDLMDLHLACARALITKTGITPFAIGLHGQTITHHPETRYTWQMGDGGWLAKKLSIPVVWDFRSGDVAMGGEGAPLAPIFHQALACYLKENKQIKDKNIAFINIGGVANATITCTDISQLDNPTQLLAFDTGPGNALMDDYMHKNFNKTYDLHGAFAATGTCHHGKLKSFLRHPWFERKPPKSLDRNFFTNFKTEGLDEADSMATYAELTAATIALASKFCNQYPQLWLVCGGGRRNGYLMERISHHFANHQSSDHQLPARILAIDDIDKKMNGDMLEAQAFAYLAARVVSKKDFAYPATTGVMKAHGKAQISYP